MAAGTAHAAAAAPVTGLGMRTAEVQATWTRQSPAGPGPSQEEVGLAGPAAGRARWGRGLLRQACLSRWPVPHAAVAVHTTALLAHAAPPALAALIAWSIRGVVERGSPWTLLALCRHCLQVGVLQPKRLVT
jgi:hypothetical protein